MVESEHTRGGGKSGMAREDRGPTGSACARVSAGRSPSEPGPAPASGGEAERRPEGVPARWEPEVPSPEAPLGFNPRYVTPGIENQPESENALQIPPAGMSGRPDWIRLVGLESQVNWLMSRLRVDYGDCVPHSGAKFFRAGALWHPGILVSWGHKSEIVMIDLQGSRLACTPVEEFMQLTFDLLKRGFRCTRIDLAVDHVGLDIKLHKHALESCRAGELCKLRTYSDDSEFKADGTPLRFLLKLGKRTSPICARIYDKGLETKTMPAGQWERFEVEYKSDRANEVCMKLAQCSLNLKSQVWNYAIGALDFRIVNGRTELSRRKITQWWYDYTVNSEPVHTSPLYKEKSFESWLKWFQGSVGPRLVQMAGMLEMSPKEFTGVILADVIEATTVTPAVLDIKNWWDAQRGHRGVYQFANNRICRQDIS